MPTPPVNTLQAQLVLSDRVAFATDLSVSGCLQALAGCGYLAPDTYNSEDLDKIQGRVDAYLTYSASSHPLTIAFRWVQAPELSLRPHATAQLTWPCLCVAP